jgi:hypothetical protein
MRILRFCKGFRKHRELRQAGLLYAFTGCTVCFVTGWLVVSGGTRDRIVAPRVRVREGWLGPLGNPPFFGLGYPEIIK